MDNTSIRDLWATSSVQDRYPSHQRTHRSPSTPRIEHEYALWVGNISETANILELRDFFLDPCPDDLLSISYHTSSRYAFANFRQDDARLTAIQYAAGNMFQGRRLDCRIRPNSSSRSIKVSYGLRAHETGEIAVGSPSYELGRKIEELTHFPECDPSQRGTKKFFVIKSFSLEAMYQSVATNQWYIPSRHAHRLNHAFQTSEKVYFLLSVNSSGTFFGWAVMTSEVQTAYEDPGGISLHLHRPWALYHPDDVIIEENIAGSDSDCTSRSRTTSVTSSGSSLASVTSELRGRRASQIPAPSTSASSRGSSPRGSITYQPERRRIVWKASATELNGSSPSTYTNDTALSTNRCRSISTPPAHLDSTNSSPCQIRWLTTDSLSFRHFRGMKNPWDEGRDVCHAKNVTPIPPDIGDTLLRIWTDQRNAAVVVP